MAFQTFHVLALHLFQLLPLLSGAQPVGLNIGHVLCWPETLLLPGQFVSVPLKILLGGPLQCDVFPAHPDEVKFPLFYPWFLSRPLTRHRPHVVPILCLHFPHKIVRPFIFSLSPSLTSTLAGSFINIC